jgi:hypothetical protein
MNENGTESFSFPFVRDLGICDEGSGSVSQMKMENVFPDYDT